MAIRSSWRISLLSVKQLAAAVAIALFAVCGWAQSPATGDTVFQMPGVFRISLPAGWQRNKVVDDNLTVAAFSSGQLTLEVMHDTSSVSLENYAKALPDRRTRYDADEYPGVYTPVEVMVNPSGYTVDDMEHFDVYKSISGLPAFSERNHLVYSKASDQKFASIVWSIFILSPGEYWSLEFRSDMRSWPADESGLRRMVSSFQLLEPTLSRVKAAVPPEAWKHMPPALPENACDFIGLASGISAVIGCDWEVVDRVDAAKDKTAAKGEVGSELVGFNSVALLILSHTSGSTSAADFVKNEESATESFVKTNKVDGRSMTYKQKEKRDIEVDGLPATRIIGTGEDKKTHREVSVQLVAITVGTDHFAITQFVFPEFTPTDSDEIERMMSSIHLFPLRPDSSVPGELPPDPTRNDAAAKAFDDDGMGYLPKADLFTLMSGCDAHPPNPPSSDKLASARSDVQLFNDSNAHLRLGVLLRASGDCSGASAEFKTAVQINPRNAAANREAARAYLSIAAEAVLATAAQNGITTTFVPAMHTSVDDAIAAWERILAYDADENDANSANTELATLYALNQNPLFAVYHQALAQPPPTKIAVSKADADNATQTMEKILSQPDASKDIVTNDPTPANRLHYAQVLISIGDYPDADEQCRIANRVKPQDAGVLACLAQLADARGEQADTIGYANQLLAVAPNSPEAYFWLARAYQWQPADYKKVAENYRAVLVNAAKAQIAPVKLQEAHLYWPYAYENAQMWQQAADAYETNVRDAPTTAQDLNNAAWFFATTTSKLRNPVKAVDYGKRAVAAAPTDPNVIDTLAQAYFISGRTDLAITTEQKALALAPTRDDLQKQLTKFKDALKAKPTPKVAPKTAPVTTPAKKAPTTAK